MVTDLAYKTGSNFGVIFFGKKSLSCSRIFMVTKNMEMYQCHMTLDLCFKDTYSDDFTCEAPEPLVIIFHH